MAKFHGQQQQKVSGSSTGETMTLKKDGYASVSVPKGARAAKQGKTNRASYSGPSVAMASRP
jgi:hypothetical protein